MLSTRCANEKSSHYIKHNYKIAPKIAPSGFFWKNKLFLIVLLSIKLKYITEISQQLLTLFGMFNFCLGNQNSIVCAFPSFTEFAYHPCFSNLKLNETFQGKKFNPDLLSKTV